MRERLRSEVHTAMMLGVSERNFLPFNRPIYFWVCFCQDYAKAQYLWAG
jgi:hypothetical protein